MQEVFYNYRKGKENHKGGFYDFLNNYSRIVFRNFIVVYYKKCYNVFRAK